MFKLFRNLYVGFVYNNILVDLFLTIRKVGMLFALVVLSNFYAADYKKFHATGGSFAKGSFMFAKL